MGSHRQRLSIAVPKVPNERELRRGVTTMAFRGWPAEALEFFEGLEADNTKAYWQEHKAVYETAVRPPMEQLLAELAPDWGDGRIHRPYRDIRFSPDKSPYRTHIAAMGPSG